MAFQPIVNLETQTIFAHEALVRGLNNESAQAIFQHINDSNRYLFDQSCRTTAIRLAAELHIPCFLSINFLPNAVYEPERCIRTTLEAAETYGFPIEQIIFEITESEQITDLVHLRKIVEYYRARGFKTAIDDFGAGYAGLNLLSEIQTDLIKLDMALIRGIDRDKVRQAIVKGVLQVAGELSSLVIAEGIETQAELSTLQGLGINLFQGFYFAKPTFQSLAQIPSDRFANVA
ncbi:EAL domain-containing protein [Picosynechococcus sp. PCC 11901]|uniref:EAL domain-containing protein n=1 Tax=Picosynechococcus sp. PCC 11901 TaxID=2579791 RepID=UPI00210371BF|nr:EAL domain-containing protein [Picosynechococcus sp. PCC 11901]